MGKAMAIQTAKGGPSALGGMFRGKKNYSGKAKLHTTRAQGATVDIAPLKYPGDGMFVEYSSRWQNVDLSRRSTCAWEFHLGLPETA